MWCSERSAYSRSLGASRDSGENELDDDGKQRRGLIAEVEGGWLVGCPGE